MPSSKQHIISEDDLRKLYDKCKSGNKIAESLGVSTATIYKWFKQYNIKTVDSPPKEASIVDCKFGKWLVLNEYYYRKSRWYFKCRCECGIESEVLIGNLTQGLSTQCKECSQKEQISGSKNWGWKGCGELCGNFYGKFKNGVIRRNMSFLVTIQYLWELFLKQNRICALSGTNLTLPKKSNGKAFRECTASLDRIDSYIGYEDDNVQWVHKIINIMKGVLPNQVFIDICHIVSDYQRSIGNYNPPFEMADSEQFSSIRKHLNTKY